MDDPVSQLVPELYDELLRQARSFASRHGGSMQPSSVVSEVWIKLANSEGSRFESRAHFSAVAAKAMRQVLADRSRKRMAAKRGGGLERVALDGLGVAQQTVTLLAIDQALTKLEQVRERAAEVVEYRLLGGLTVPEIAVVMDVSEGTVKREWRVARAFLVDALG